MAVITMKTSAVAAAAAAAVATKGAAPNVDDNDADNEVKARAAQRGEEGRMLGSSDWQDAAVQRNHRVEGFLCAAHIARTPDFTAREARTRTLATQKKEKNCRQSKCNLAVALHIVLRRKESTSSTAAVESFFYCTIAACQRQTVLSTANRTPKIFVFEVKSGNICPSFGVHSSHIDRYEVFDLLHPLLTRTFSLKMMKSGLRARRLQVPFPGQLFLCMCS